MWAIIKDIIGSIFVGILVMMIPMVGLLVLIIGGVYTLGFLAMIAVLSLFYLIGKGIRP